MSFNENYNLNKPKLIEKVRSSEKRNESYSLLLTEFPMKTKEDQELDKFIDKSLKNVGRDKAKEMKEDAFKYEFIDNIYEVIEEDNESPKNLDKNKKDNKKIENSKKEKEKPIEKEIKINFENEEKLKDSINPKKEEKTVPINKIEKIEVKTQEIKEKQNENPHSKVNFLRFLGRK